MRRVNALPLQEVAEQYLEKAYRYFLLLFKTGDSWPAAGSTTAVAIAEARRICPCQSLGLEGLPRRRRRGFPAPTRVCWSPCSLKSDRMGIGLTSQAEHGVPGAQCAGDRRQRHRQRAHTAVPGRSQGF